MFRYAEDWCMKMVESGAYKLDQIGNQLFVEYDPPYL